MVYPIYIYGSSVLRKKTLEISSDYPGLRKLMNDMFETLRVSDGVGLAAPQIGIPVRLFVVDTAEMEQSKNDTEDNPGVFKEVFINPRITKLWGERRIYNEGCLSVPTLREDIDRPENVRIEYYDEDFNFRVGEFNGIISRIIQHEYDHLEGILFVDRINPLKKKLLNGKLKDISKGKVDVNYKIKIPL